MSADWCLIESGKSRSINLLHLDPGVFTEMIKKFGCNGLEVEEIIDLDLLQKHSYVFLSLEITTQSRSWSNFFIQI